MWLYLTKNLHAFSTPFHPNWSLYMLHSGPLKGREKKSNINVTLLALGSISRPYFFFPASLTKSSGGNPVNSSAEQIMWKCWQQQIWAEWAIFLIFIFLRSSAGDREHEWWFFSTIPLAFDKRNEPRSPESSCQSLWAVWLFLCRGKS